ncbi:MAG: YbgC/FadM family acyl-CoA thioesterase [Planctomycetia bacterium]|nr:YbgC/FadM family acyl-CoA thioesterase [Planctomycetia bacterium]
MIEYDYHTHVYYRDVDQMGIVYYTRYLEYFEAARTELLRSIGLDVTKIEQMGYFLPVISCSCIYKKSAKFDEELNVITKINILPRSSMKIEYEVFNSNKILLVTGYTIHSFTNLKGRAVKPPKILIEKLRG